MCHQHLFPEEELCECGHNHYSHFSFAFSRLIGCKHLGCRCEAFEELDWLTNITHIPGQIDVCTLL